MTARTVRLPLMTVVLALGAALLPSRTHGTQIAGGPQAPEPPITPRQPKLPPGHARVLVLWPSGAPFAVGRSDLDTPRLFVYPAHVPATERTALNSPRTGVIVLPGGAYRTLMMEKEGANVARWLSEHGVDAFVLQYRLGPRYHFPVPMLDGARAVRYVRSHATELGVAPNKVGVWGFSAGGHLAGWLATVHDAGNARAADPVDRSSDRPDFAILSYARLSMDPSIPRPTNLESLIGSHPSPETLATISIDRHVSRDTTPCLIFSTTADEVVNSLTATTFYSVLKRNHVPAELHIFERGPHGMALGLGLQHLPELGMVPTLVENWMQVHGWMEDRPEHPA